MYVKGIPYSTTEEELRSHFGSCGEICSVDVPYDHNGSCKGFAFVKFAGEEGMQSALSLNETDFNGRTICVKPATGTPKAKGKGKGDKKE